MTLRPQKAYFLVRINKEEQRKREQIMDNGLFLPTDIGMTRCMQHGEIIDIGEMAHKHFPEAKIGDIAIFHHFIEGHKESEGDEDIFLIDSDEIFNYYIITGLEYSGEATLIYGVWDGKQIIPHSDYIFLETAAPPENKLAPEELVEKATTVSAGGLIIFKEWKETREDKQSKIDILKKECEELGTNEVTYDLKMEIEKRQKEIEEISGDIHHKNYFPHTIAACNSCLDEWFNCSVRPGDTMYLAEWACQTRVEFKGKEFIVARSEYIGFLWQ